MTTARISARSIRRRTAFLLAPSLLAALAACEDLRDPAVVTIGGETYTLGDLRREYADLEANLRPPLGVRESRRAFVDRLIERRLLADYGDSLLAASPDSEAEWTRDRNEILLRRLRVIVGAGPPPTPDEIDEAIARMGFRLRVERVQFPDEASALEARARIAAGEPFEKVAAAAPGVRLADQWIEWQPTAGELADRAAGLAVGSVSEVFRWGFVDQILRIAERIPLELPAAPQLTTSVSSGLRLRRTADRMRVLADALWDRTAVHVDDAAVTSLARRTEEAILEGTTTQHERDWAIPTVEGPEAEVVATWEGGRLTSRDYVEALRSQIPAQRPSGEFLARKVRAAVRLQVSSRLLLAEARRRGLEEDWWVERATRKARESLEVRVALEAIEKAIPVEPAAVDSVAEFLRSMPVEMFRHEERARVLRFDFPDRAAATRELRRIREAGDGVARLRELIRGDPAFDGSVHVLSITEAGLARPEIASLVLDERAPRLSGPFELAGRWVVFDRLALVPSRPMTEEEVRKAVEDRVRNERAGAARLAWLEQRRRERAVTVDEDLLDALSPGG